MPRSAIPQDQYLFDAMDTSADFAAITEMADRIPDELAGTVIGDVIAGIDVMDLATSCDPRAPGATSKFEPEAKRPIV